MIRTPLPLDVIIPVFGAGPQLERTLDALQRQAPSVGRIIVSHSGDGDPTARLADRGVTVLHSRTRLYAGAARNRGLAVSDAAWMPA